MRVRVFALAKELGIDSKELIDYCSDLGIQVKTSALAGITPEQRDKVVAYYEKKKASGGESAQTEKEHVPVRDESAVEKVGKVRKLKAQSARVRSIPQLRADERDEPKPKQQNRRMPPPDPNRLSGQPTNPDQETGALSFGEKYELLEVIGQGGMGTVWKAQQHRPHRLVAIKRMRPEFVTDTAFRTRFEREANALATLDDPHIVPILDYDEDREGPYFVMKWIDGKSLEQRLTYDPLRLPTALDIFIPIARSLHAAHRQKVLHRDLKPANILIDTRGRPYLIDFGIARTESATTGSTLTKEGTLGTIDYMSPEQARDPRSVTAQSDLWSLAATLYYALTGYPMMSRKDALLPEAIRPVLLKAVEYDPRDRQRDLAEFAHELEQATRDEGVDSGIDLADLDEALGLSTKDFDSEVFESVFEAADEPEQAATDSLPTTYGVCDTGELPAGLIAPFSQAEAAEAQTAWARHLGTEVEFTNSVGMTFRLIPQGVFLMGSPDGEGRDDELPQHHVQLTELIWFQTTTVTQGQWQALMGTTPWKGKGVFFVQEGTDYPATNVDWDDATEFCHKLSAKEEMTYRLPTEAEWEYACRAGTMMRWSFGNDEDHLGEYAWFDKNAWNVGAKYAHRVGLKYPNKFGLYDMHGNIWEWCNDLYDRDCYDVNSRACVPAPVRDPTGPTFPTYDPHCFRILRGGSFGSYAYQTRSGYRNSKPPSYCGGRYGFRVVVE